MSNSSIIARVGALAALGAGMTAAANQLNGIRVHDAPDSTRIVLDTSAAASYRLFTMKRPERLVIDLYDTGVAASFVPPAVDSRIVEEIRTAPRKRSNYRVVLDLQQRVASKEFTLPPVPPYDHRLVIDLYPHEPGEQPKQTITRGPEGQRDVVVVLDAGHGGEDPGAIGVGGVREKEVVLSIARSIKARLDAKRGVRAVLTRTGDYYIALRKRTEIARRPDVRADLFVSIHADAFRSSKVRGASVYALSQRGASSEIARWLAASENRSDLIGGVGGSVPLNNQEEAVAKVLVDLSMDHKMRASIDHGEAVLGALSTVTKLHKRRVEQAGFAVLKSPDVPAILIETGFLSNPDEARRLADAGHRRRIAVAIADGIIASLLRNPPQDTLLASAAQGGMWRYVIKRGDTLSEIAQRERVSMRQLRALNRLADDRIRIDQVLLIPSGEGLGE